MMQYSTTLLLVEDDPVDGELFGRALAKSGLRVDLEWLRDGPPALDYLFGRADDQRDLPGIVVLDIKLPQMLGFEILECIRLDERTHRVPVVMFSSSNQAADVDLAYRLGANSYLNKPSGFVPLTELVNHLATYWLTLNRAGDPSYRIAA